MIDEFHGGSITPQEQPKPDSEHKQTPQVEAKPQELPEEQPKKQLQPEPQLEPKLQPYNEPQNQPDMSPQMQPAIEPSVEPHTEPKLNPQVPAATVAQPLPPQSEVPSPEGAVPKPEIAAPAQLAAQPQPEQAIEVNAEEEAQNQRDQQEEEQQTEAAFEAAMQLIAAGQGVEQILGSGDFANLPEHIKQQLRARLQQAAAQREMQQHEMAKQTREKTMAAKAVGKLFTLGMMSGLISKSTMDKINALFAQQPHLQQQIQMTGQALLQAGAQPDIEFAKSSVKIVGKAVATPQIEQQQTQEQQR